MRNAVLVSAVRTPVGKMGGVFKSIDRLDMTDAVIKEAINRAGIDSSMDYWLDNPDVLANGTFVSTDRRNLIPTIRTGEVTAAFLSFTDDMNHDIPEQEQYLVNVYDDEKNTCIGPGSGYGGWMSCWLRRR